VSMKAEVDDRIGGQMRMVFSGASEAYLIAKELRKSPEPVLDTRDLTGTRPSARWCHSYTGTTDLYTMGRTENVGTIVNCITTV